MEKIPVGKPKQQRIVVHNIKDLATLPFSAEDYSLFKFGSKSRANSFGKQLFLKFKEYLFSKYGAVYKDNVPQIVVCSAPYNHIPTATGAMKDYFVKYLNEHLAEMGAPVVQEAKVHRDTTYREDYGAMTKEQRETLIGGDTFHVDVSFLKDKLVLFIDDIRITGSHEHMMEKMIMRLDGIEATFDHLFLYYAKLNDPDTCPTIENDLNYAAVTELNHILALAMASDFVFNTRVIKYMLKYNPIEFEIMMTLIHREDGGDIFLDTLYHLAIGNSYHLIPEYEENLALLRDLLNGELS